MSLTEKGIAGRSVTHEPDNEMGVIQQNPESTNSSVGAPSASGDVNYGVPIVVTGMASIAADGTTNVSLLADNPSTNRPHKYRVALAWYTMRTLRTGGTPAHTVQLLKGDGAGSYTTITDVNDADITADTQTLFATTDDAEYDIDVDEGLQLRLVVSGTTTTGTALAEVHALLVPVK